ncbi:MAG: cell division protein ZapB [Pseudomonadota bacterium]
MDADLKALEEKIAQLVTLCQSLRGENQDLRQEVAQIQDEARRLRDQMAQASVRLEAVIDKLPETIL